MAPTFLLFILLVHLCSITIMKTCNASVPAKFPAVLIFGDSTVDTGNNNFIPSLFRGNHYPYGREFPHHTPTGRFSNGRLVPDLLASALGIKEFVPPFLDPHLSNKELLTGVSFASAGSGLDDITGTSGGVIPVMRQPHYFRMHIERLKWIVGEQEAKKIISGALVLISAGTNDFIFNYYDIPTRRYQFTMGGYQKFLQQRLRQLVKELYDLGCRIFVIPGLAPMGCVPLQMTAKFKYPMARTCVHDENSDARAYNSKLEKLILKMEASLPGSKIVYSNLYDPVMDMINHPQNYGFVETKKGCCGTGFMETGPLCNYLTPTCDNSSQYLFWDSVHPGELTYRHVAENLLKEILSKIE
ncbi:hypothetical protein HHK36_010639 [Tetracentron sinense]|uniref:Uncharacterized protein n=1 Tax=Tetracentron sinense TaxID=13715 RepID=A0A835DGI1_TETSI|nr:hypothetical protein HHK36_010639 [Tetracentron sinense]